MDRSTKSSKPFKVETAVRSALRRLWLWSPMRTAALQRARIKRGIYRCAKCKMATPKKSIAVDHVTPVTPVDGFDTWDGFIERLFCPPSHLNVLCKPCHTTKTKLENESRKKNREVTGKNTSTGKKS